MNTKSLTNCSIMEKQRYNYTVYVSRMLRADGYFGDEHRADTILFLLSLFRLFKYLSWKITRGETTGHSSKGSCIRLYVVFFYILTVTGL